MLHINRHIMIYRQLELAVDYFCKVRDAILRIRTVRIDRVDFTGAAGRHLFTHIGVTRNLQNRHGTDFSVIANQHNQVCAPHAAAGGVFLVIINTTNQNILDVFGFGGFGGFHFRGQLAGFPLIQRKLKIKINPTCNECKHQ